MGKALHQNGIRKYIRQRYESRKNVEMRYGEIKAVFRLYSPKSRKQSLFMQPLTFKMVKVQRLSPCGRVKSQANGERKIRLLRNKDEQIVYARLERE